MKLLGEFGVLGQELRARQRHAGFDAFHVLDQDFVQAKVAVRGQGRIAGHDGNVFCRCCSPRRIKEATVVLDKSSLPAISASDRPS